jgi:hypothetical protein
LLCISIVIDFLDMTPDDANCPPNNKRNYLELRSSMIKSVEEEFIGCAEIREIFPFKNVLGAIRRWTS